MVLFIWSKQKHAKNNFDLKPFSTVDQKNNGSNKQKQRKGGQ